MAPLIPIFRKCRITHSALCMGHDMKFGILPIIAALAITGPAYAEAPSAPAVTIKGSGAGKWEVLCHVTSNGGDETVRALEPSRDTFATNNIRRATCNYKNGSTGPLTITVISSTFTCPFKGAAEGECVTQYNKGAFGTFEVRRGR